MSTQIGLYAKAVFAFLMAALTAVYAALDGENGNITDREWVGIAIAGVTALGVYFTPNARKSETRTRPPKWEG